MSASTIRSALIPGASFAVGARRRQESDGADVEVLPEREAQLGSRDDAHAHPVLTDRVHRRAAGWVRERGRRKRTGVAQLQVGGRELLQAVIFWSTEKLFGVAMISAAASWAAVARFLAFAFR